MNDTFSDILLNVSSGKDFYAVWDSEYTNSIENFALEDNVFVRAEKIDWIQELPNVLTFQMNRLKFEQGKAKKMLHEVKIDKIIYPDRFMMQNQQQVEAKRNLVKKLRMNVNFLEGCLQKYKNFGGSEVNIFEAISLTLGFVQN